MSEAAEVMLSEPVQAHGEQLSKLTLRPATGKDLRLCGNPFRIVVDEDGIASPVFDAKACAKLLSELAGVPPSTIDNLAAGDFWAAQLRLLDFFGVATPPKS